MSYSNVYKKSFRIFWKHKVLWVVGMITKLYLLKDILFNDQYLQEYISEINPDNRYGNPFKLWDELHPFVAQNPSLIIIGILLATILIIGISVLVTSFVNGAIVGSVNKIEIYDGLSIKNVWEKGKTNLNKLLKISIFFYLLIILFFSPIIIKIIPIYSSLYSEFGVELFTLNNLPPEILYSHFEFLFSEFSFEIFPLFCMIFVFIFIFSTVEIFAIYSLVIEDLDILESIKRGLTIAVSNFWNVLLSIIILGIIGLILTIIVLIPDYAMFIYFTINGFPNMGQSFSIITNVLITVNLIITSIIFPGIIGVYMKIYWVNLYKYFISEKSKLAEIIDTTPVT